jgi:hypothetical protein
VVADLARRRPLGCVGGSNEVVRDAGQGQKRTRALIFVPESPSTTHGTRRPLGRVVELISAGAEKSSGVGDDGAFAAENVYQEADNAGPRGRILGTERR